MVILSSKALCMLKIIVHFQMEAPLWNMCLERDTGREHAMDYLSSPG